MTSEQVNQLLQRLQRKLGLEEAEEDELLLLNDELLDAYGELLIYLGMSDLEESFFPKVVELAALYYRRDQRELEGGGLKSSGYTEGQISQTESYLTPAEFRSGVEEVLDSLSRYRRVTC